MQKTAMSLRVLALGALVIAITALPLPVSAGSFDNFLRGLKNLENATRQYELKQAAEFEDEGGPTATYILYRDGKLTAKTEDITESAALYNCKENIALVPTVKTTCVWDGETIHTAKKVKKSKAKNKDALSCALATPKKTYQTGEFVELLWTSSGKDLKDSYTLWKQDGGAELLGLSTEKGAYTGNEFYTAQGDGEVSVTLELVRGKERTTCSTTFTVTKGASVSQGATVVGIEEGIYLRRPGKNKIETTYGTTTVHISPSAGSAADPLVLVLTARNAVAWIIDNPANVPIQKVIASGRGLQLVEGLAEGVPVEYFSNRTGNGGPHTYKGSGQSYDNLVRWLRGQNLWIEEFVSGGKVSGEITID